MHLAADYLSFPIRRLSDGAEIKVAVPHDAKLGAPVWSPDGKQFAFTNTTGSGIELWLGASATGQTRKVEGLAVHTVRIGGGGGRGGNANGPVQWLGDNKTLIVQAVPAGRGKAPVEAALP